MIGGDGINDESNKTAPPPPEKNYLTKPQLPIEHKQVEDFLEAGFVYFIGVGFF